MRISLVLAAASLAVLTALTGCASSLGSASGGERLAVAVDAPVQTSSDVVEITEGATPVTPEAAAQGRRRLSQTVTLGQGGAEPVYVPVPQGAGVGGNVIVNNNVTVVNGQPAYGYGGYGGYGYGYGYGSGRGFGLTGSRDGRGGGGMPANGAWAPNGFEGAQRTAAPGQTPGVGGNWSPAPSFGPRTQK